MKRSSMIQYRWQQLGNRSRLRFTVPLAFFTLSLIWGCGPEIKVPPLTLADISRLEAAANYTQQNYHIEPGDSLNIRYTFHPEMNQEELVRRDGKISAVLVGEVSVAGLTTDELAKYLVA